MNGSEQENPEIQAPQSLGTPPSPVEPPAQIQWGVLFRLASPLAIVTGVVSALLSPLTALVVLPLSLKRIIARYRPFHSGALQAIQGVLMGIFMAFLSFVAFLVFFLATLSLKREQLFAFFRDQAAQSHDPQTQQRFLSLATNEGFIAIAILALFVTLVVFLAAGAISGAFITRSKKPAQAP